MSPLTEDDDFADPSTASTVSAWVSRIEETIEECETKWQLDIGVELMKGMKGYLLRVRRPDGSPAVLKLRSPDELFEWEVACLTAFDGSGSVRLYDSDAEMGALLLEWVDPGTRMHSYMGEVDLDEVAGDIMRRLWRDPSGVAVPTLAERAYRWADNTERMNEEGPVSAQFRRDAARMLRELSDTQTESVLIHGDLYVHNILKGTREPWVSVDPKGAIGERCFDVAWWFRDPFRIEAGHDMTVLRRGLDMLVDMLDLDRERIVNWAWSVSVTTAASRIPAMMPAHAKQYAGMASAFYELR